MQENTKKYLKNMLDELEIETNTLQMVLDDVLKLRRKLIKFYKKVVK